MEREDDARHVMESTPIDTILCTKTASPRWTAPGPRRRLPASEAAGLQLYEYAFETHRHHRYFLRSEIRLRTEPRRDGRQLPAAGPPGRLARALLPLRHEGRRADGPGQWLRSLARRRARAEVAARPVPSPGRRSPDDRFESARHVGGCRQGSHG